jgi:hypothetical protein
LLRNLATAALALSLSACALQPIEAEPPVQRGVELTDVPFYPQEAFQCGPAALATVLGAAGAVVHPDDLDREVYLPASQGSLQAELVAAARRHDRVPYVLAPTREALQAELAAGHPVLVLQNLAFAWYPKWHYAVVVGIDDRNHAVILRSGRERRHVIPWRMFARTWDRAQRWAVVVAPPDRMPATAQETAYLQAVAALERLDRWDMASRAYRSALARWPQSLAAHIGLGNTLYAAGDLAGAAEILHAAAQAHPFSAVAANNLAFVLAQQGDLGRAEAAATRAVELGSGQAQYQQTLAEIRARRCVSALCPDAVLRR